MIYSLLIINKISLMSKTHVATYYYVHTGVCCKYDLKSKSRCFVLSANDILCRLVVNKTLLNK